MIASRLGRALGPGKLMRVQRGSGAPQWVLDYVDGQGRRRRQALSTDRRAAERLRIQLISQRDLEAAGLGAVEGQSMPLVEVRDLYLSDLEVRVGAKQLRSVRDALARVLGWLRATRVRDVRVVDLMRYRGERLREGVSNRTVNIETGALKAMLNWAVAAQLIAENPVRSFKRLPWGEKHQRHVRRALSDDEIARFLDAAEHDDIDCAARVAATRTIEVHGRGKRYARRRRAKRIPQRLLWQALLETGARWSELISVTWVDLEVERRALTLRAVNTKSGRSRVIPLRAELVQELLALRAIHPRATRRVVQAGDRVFLTPDGAQHDKATTGMRRLFRRVLERAAIDRYDAMGRVIDMHGLRGTCATRMARNHVPLPVAQRVLGHSSPVMTMKHYVHLDVDDLRAAVELGTPPARPRLVPSSELEATA